VGDDVMQLASDRRPFLVDGDPGQLLALPFGLGGTLCERTGVAMPRLDVGTERPNADDQQNGGGGAERARRPADLRCPPSRLTGPQRSRQSARVQRATRAART
jgi:hypothetical protein